MEDEQVSYDRRHGCIHCGSLTFSNEYFKAFNVLVCNSCKQNEELIAKGNAKSLYMLTDGDLKKLGTLSKTNPQNKQWAPLKLYLLSQIEEAAHKKHGGPDGVEEARKSSIDHRQERRAAKRKLETEKEERDAERLKRIKERIQEEEAQRAQEGQQGASADVELI
ncbi:g3700 [Coccomyxa viridis]|uniref:G3700 protein n=1 Tax=Coccomyxa viridis TaxID=1274662 RepID=A0ABP1FTS0_9CHLO